MFFYRSFEGNAVVEFQRWTGKRKADAVLDIIKGGINSLKVNPKDAAAQKQKEVEELQKVVGEQALVIRVLKKA